MTINQILPHIRKRRMTPHHDMDGQSFFEWLLNESESHLLAAAMQKEYSTLRSYAQRVPRYGERGGGRPSPVPRIEELITGFRRLRWSWHIRQIQARVSQKCIEALREIEATPSQTRPLDTQTCLIELHDQTSRTIRAITENPQTALVELENLIMTADAIRVEIQTHQHQYANSERINNDD